ncbi:MAG: hypothetical protein AABW48_02805 [Nanoarchaeota archaeon]
MNRNKDRLKRLKDKLGLKGILVGTFSIIFIVVLLVLFFGASSTGWAKVTGRSSAVTQCNDHIDNDGDGFCDFLWKRAYCTDGSEPGDKFCSDKNDNSEGFCGDGSCDSTEDCSCKIDCGACQPGDCIDTDGGDNIYKKGTTTGPGLIGPKTDYCQATTVLSEYFCNQDYIMTERLRTCPSGWTCSDGACVAGTPVCGDGSCNGVETCNTCASDCGTCVYCSNGVCDGNETCLSCAADCGACASECLGVNGTSTTGVCLTQCGADSQCNTQLPDGYSYSCNDNKIYDVSGSRACKCDLSCKAVFTVAGCNPDGTDASGLCISVCGAANNCWGRAPGTFLYNCNADGAYNVNGGFSCGCTSVCQVGILGGEPSPSCGDNVCNGAETCSSCTGDCGTCPGGNETNSTG